MGIYNTAQSYAVTGDVGSALKSGAIAAVSALAFQQIGKHFKAEFGIKPGSNLSFGDLELGQQLQWAGSHAVVGGVSSVLSGGKFGHGFISAGFTKMAMGNAGFNLNNRAWPAIAGRTAIAAIVGGTASALTGGKFSNGARSAAMMHLLNQEARAALTWDKGPTTLDDLKEKYGWKKGQTKIFYGKRELGGFAYIESGSTRANDINNQEVLHEHMFIIDKNGALHNRGFTGAKYGVGDDFELNKTSIGDFYYSSKAFTRGSSFNVDSFKNHYNAGNGWAASDYRLFSHNCQDYASATRRLLSNGRY
ncbi:DUF637 domain-containing protein [Pseudoalteromonas sp. Of7M-16]|uniref:DUF637 domain-containing protein n=1 Tax=Pseudoalteromonas sp. Of7M-16 TaxID=2917756 RepID=UPI001EF68620|nr:DUF637 domain-containing protein [Pseudoalteromonas sp. Of7M-16]MCG7551780.1 DUF637 domain-containing protein [Pseudoalteromonas sp. Of7M-16]